MESHFIICILDETTIRNGILFTGDTCFFFQKRLLLGLTQVLKAMLKIHIYA